MLDEEVSWFALIIRSDFVKVVLQYYAELGDKDLILALITRDIHHLDELGSGIFFYLKDE